MKSQRTIVCIMLAAVVATGVMGLRATRAQRSEYGAPRSSGVATLPSTGVASRGTGSIEAKIRQATERLRDAEDSAAKASARQELATTLGQYFDEDMADREKELAKLKERLRKLTEQLERRRTKRQEIIDLQIQVAVNEADGLGFLSRPAYGSLPGLSDRTYGAPSNGVSSNRLTDEEKSLVVPAPAPHQQSREQYSQPQEEPETVVE